MMCKNRIGAATIQLYQQVADVKARAVSRLIREQELRSSQNQGQMKNTSKPNGSKKRRSGRRTTEEKKKRSATLKKFVRTRDAVEHDKKHYLASQNQKGPETSTAVFSLPNQKLASKKYNRGFRKLTEQHKNTKKVFERKLELAKELLVLHEKNPEAQQRFTRDAHRGGIWCDITPSELQRIRTPQNQSEQVTFTEEEYKKWNLEQRDKLQAYSQEAAQLGKEKMQARSDKYTEMLDRAIQDGKDYARQEKQQKELVKKLNQQVENVRRFQEIKQKEAKKQRREEKMKKRQQVKKPEDMSFKERMQFFRKKAEGAKPVQPKSYSWKKKGWSA